MRSVAQAAGVQRHYWRADIHTTQLYTPFSINGIRQQENIYYNIVRWDTLKSLQEVAMKTNLELRICYL